MLMKFSWVCTKYTSVMRTQNSSVKYVVEELTIVMYRHNVISAYQLQDAFCMIIWLYIKGVCCQ